MARRGRRGEGTVYFSKADRRWVARWPLGTTSGRRRDKRVKCRTERQALNELERLRRIYRAGGRPATGSLGDYLQDWLAGLRDLQPSTVRSYRGHVDLHISPLLGGIPLAELTPRDVDRLLDALRDRAPATRARVVTTLRIALNEAVRRRTLVDNPATHVRLPKSQREPVRALSRTAADRVLDAVAGSPFQNLYVLLYGSGMRLGEAVGLDWRDVHLDDGYVEVRHSKTGARSVPLSDDAVEALRRQRGDRIVKLDEPVFVGPRKGGRLAGTTATHAFQRALERAGLPRMRVHDLRHGTATGLLAEGVDMRTIAEQLGHKNPATTARIYAHVVPELQRQAIRSLNRRRVV